MDMTLIIVWFQAQVGDDTVGNCTLFPIMKSFFHHSSEDALDQVFIHLKSALMIKTILAQFGWLVVCISTRACATFCSPVLLKG